MSDIARMQLDTTIAEFNALRQEIIHRSGSQHGLMSLGMTIAVGVAAFAFADADGLLRAELLLLIPLAVLPLGLLWLDHHGVIARLGIHIKVVHRASVIRVLAEAGYDPATDALMRWQWHPCRTVVEKEARRALLFVLPQAVVFFLPAAAGWGAGALFLIFGPDPLSDLWWAIGTAVMGGALLLWSGLHWRLAFREGLHVRSAPAPKPPPPAERAWTELDSVDEARFLGQAWIPFNKGEQSGG